MLGGCFFQGLHWVSLITALSSKLTVLLKAYGFPGKVFYHPQRLRLAQQILDKNTASKSFKYFRENPNWKKLIYWTQSENDIKINTKCAGEIKGWPSQ